VQIVPGYFGQPLRQYRATRTMAATSNAATSESALSRAFERGFGGVTSIGGITQLEPFQLHAGFVGRAPVSKFQVGGFNSPASQPRAPDVMGSLDTTVV
jgi:hypothetical protein